MKDRWGKHGPVGEWRVEGRTPGGTAYQGVLSIERSQDVLEAHWQSPQLGARFGTGLMQNGLLLLARGPGPVRPGNVWYTLASNGDLEAVWNTTDLGGLVGTGRAIGGRPGDLTGTRSIVYFDVNGNELQPPYLDLEVERDGKVYRLDWKERGSGAMYFSGVGLEVRNGLVASWDEVELAEDLDVLIFDVQEGSRGTVASAIWATTGETGPAGEEIIRRTR